MSPTACRDDRNRCCPDCTTSKQIADDNANNTAAYKHTEHSEVVQHPFDKDGIFVRKKFVKMDSDLTDMVSTKSSCHRDSFRLAEGVVLHGTDKVDGNLRNLIWSRIRDILKINFK